MPIPTLIADDEPLARERLRDLLESDDRFEVVAEAATGLEALERIRALEPRLAFLDVQMPELSGIEALAELVSTVPAERRPVVVLVTAYDEFALQAFDLNAVDYLLKPFDRARFLTALEKALQLIQKPEPQALDRRVAALLEALGAAPPEGRGYTERLSIKTDGRVILVRVEDIDWIGAANNYVEIHAGGTTHLMRETLSALEAKLDPQRFLRVSRSTIVAIDRIREIQPLFYGEHALVLQGGVKLTASRSYREALKSLLQ